jgi:hypothetical protein
MHEDGNLRVWDRCLFVIADAGADVIICWSLLNHGSILRYNPPAGYEGKLRSISQQYPAALAVAEDAGARNRRSTAPTRARSVQYQEPARIVKVFYTEITGQNSKKRPLRENTENHSHSNYIEIVLNSPSNDSRISLVCEPLTAGTLRYGVSPPEFECPTQRARALITQAPPRAKSAKRKGETDMLTDENPYGKNPPLPEEVMQALKHLKTLAEPGKTPEYTSAQLELIRKSLGANRPRWANGLTVAHTLEVADKQTELFLYDLMDKPVYQESIFSTNLTGNCDLGEYELNQKEGRDQWTPPQPRRFKNPLKTAIVDNWLDDLLQYDKCRLSKATHPAVVTIVEKDARDPRVCIDYRNRNARTEVPIYPMPDVQEFLDDTAGFQFYCSFDMAKMFNQFKIKESHRALAAFITHRGVYEPNVVMFGLAGGPQHAVREVGGAMAEDPLTNGKDFTTWALEQNSKGADPPYEICPSLGIVKGSRLKPFIDDVTIPSNHTEGMKKLVELFFEFCRKHGLILSRKKAKIMKKYLCMLGFVVSREGKHLDPSRIIKLLEAKQPQSKETLHALLSSYTFVRMFIPNFASIASPLYDATRGIVWKGPLSGRAQGIRTSDPNFVWTPEMTRAYDQLRNGLLEAPILMQVDWNYPLFLSVDASIRGEGWVLWQLLTMADGTKVAVAILYGSRKYSDSEKNWETTRQEASAIRSALTDVQDYVFGNHFYLFSDHLNLRYMHNSINRAVLRMRDFLTQFNMTIVHCPGIWNNADSMSRLEQENLPSELASDLNSASEAKMDGASTIFSTGTSTTQDYLTEGCIKLQPKPWNAEPTSSFNEGNTARVLCSHSEITIAARCFLCDAHDLNDDDDSDSEQLDTIPCQSTCLNTNVQINARTRQDWEEVTPLLNQFKETPFTLLMEEAQTWNERHSKNKRVALPEYCQETTPTNPTQDDDLDWCGEIDRPATTRKDICPKNFESTQRDVHWTTGITALKDIHTQTTPADFRIATINFPMQEDFMAIHNNESGHHGAEYSYRKLLVRCGSKWANEKGAATKIQADLKQFIDSCPICQKVRGLKEKIKPKHSFIISRPFLEVSYDFVVFTREDKNGNRYLLVAICNFLKLVEIKPVKNRDAETVARFLLELGSRYGPIIRLRHDREKAFTGLLIKKINENRGTEEVPCIPYHPQANSICERQNGIIMIHMNALILGCKLGPESKVGWSDLVPFVFSLVNTTPKNPLGISPLSMLYGVFANYDQPLLPTNQANKVGTISNPQDYFDNLVAWQNELLEITERIQSEHFEKLQHRFNNDKVAVRTFNEGDFVLQTKLSTSVSGKPNTRWTGPFLVMNRTENDPSHPVLHLMDLTTMKIKEASINDCRQFNTSWFDEDNLMPELVKLAATDKNEYVVEKIISHKPSGSTRKVPLSRYLFEVKWEDFEETTWEPYSNLKDLAPLEDYASENPGLKIPLLK